MTDDKFHIYKIKKKNSQVKVILAFIHYIYTIYVIVLNLDDVRTRNWWFGCSNICLSYYVRYSTRATNICYQKESRLFVCPLAANDVFRILEITFPPGTFLIFFQFRHLSLFCMFCQYGLNFILKRFIGQCWAAIKKQCVISPFQLFRQLHHHTFL